MKPSSSQKRFKANESNNLKNSNIQKSKIKYTNKEKLKKSIKSTIRIETIENYPGHNKEITENITSSTPNADRNSETIESNNDFNNSLFSLKNFKKVSDTIKVLSDQNVPIKVALKSFGEKNTMAEQMQNYLKFKVTEYLWDKLQSEITDLQIIRNWEKKFVSLQSEVRKVAAKMNRKKNGKIVPNNQITHFPKPSTSKIPKVTTINSVSPSITTNPFVIDLISDDEEN